MRKHPPWIKVKISANDEFVRMRRLVASQALHTVCESAACPNIGECWGRGTATFMILGGNCSRNCRFCDVRAAHPEPVDPQEPERVAKAIRTLALKHAVITSVTRDDLPDGGSQFWADTIGRIRELNPTCRIEVLIPDFQGDRRALERIVNAGPDILGHNLETVWRLYPQARPQADYQQSLQLLKRAKEAGCITKSGVMLGMGERECEVREVLQDMRQAGCDILTFGQYLQPTRQHLPVVRYWTPEEFQCLKEEGNALGFLHIESGPLVRSSYHADRVNLAKRLS
ncbi:lipoyl synthase [candidate division KSB3 bacterium]|uniref:Lipoyl synthase n=1 Tax=candidate division KSB3 bacterium TaxID=2044937 RepID=A0A2G6E563_9BACT|nr:MAG: lipoyl synthase [candidate division KSB3 bacterium]PIE29506.1 MAG: lipoyl synthase [candidate division KSB3 bacterium]